MNCANEADLDEAEFREIAKFAASPPPAIPLATEDDARELIAFLAATLPTQKNSTDTNRVKLGAYRFALAGQPKAALTHAVQVAIRTMEWLPAPAELLKIAESFNAPERIAHERAKSMTFQRRQRLFEETLRNIRDRRILVEELAALDDYTARVAETQGHLVIRLDGSRQYRTKETIHAHLADLEARAREFRPTDERDKRAEDAPTVDGNGGCGGETAPSLTGGPESANRAVRASEGDLGRSGEIGVGDIAAGIMAGMEVSDGE